MTDTAVLPAPVRTGATDVVPRGRRFLSQHRDWFAFSPVLLTWILYVLPARGGWESFVIPVACVLLVPTLLVLRPWRRCPPALIALAVAPSCAAVLVGALTAYGDGAAISLSRWGYFSGLLLATSAFARTRTRRQAVLVALLLGGLQQYTDAWLPWWGGGESVDGPMLGTLYSANPFGSLMLAFSCLAAVAAVLGSARLRALGLLVAPLCASAVVLSAARAAMLLLVTAGGLLILLGLRQNGARGLLRAVAVILLAWGALVLTTSSVFFSAEVNALAATTSKSSAGQTLDSTTGVRLDYWTAAWGQFLDDPLLGAGSGSYQGASRLRMPPAAELSPFAHNEVLGALAEGGLVLGLPVLLVVLSSLAVCGGTLVRALARPRAGPCAAQVGAGLAAGALLIHSMVDFALSIPAVLGLVGILVGLCWTAQESSSVRGPATRALAAAVLLSVGLGGAYLGVAHDRAGVGAVARGSAVDDGPLPGVRDARVSLAAARRAIADEQASGHRGLQLMDSVRPMARFDGRVEALYWELVRAQGHTQLALDGSRELARRSRQAAPLLLVPYAEHLQRAGSAQQAHDLLVGEAYRRAAEQGRLRGQLIDLLEEADRLTGRREPGFGCAVQALQPRPASAESKRARPSAPAIDPAVCAAWMRQAQAVLGARQ